MDRRGLASRLLKSPILPTLLLTELSADQPRTVRFLAGLIDLVQGLGLRAVVEGLSSPELVELACILGANAGQGYALSRPLSPKDVPVWVRNFS